jgi:hypothetical protein
MLYHQLEKFMSRTLIAGIFYLLTQNAVAYEFVPTVVETTNFKAKNSRTFSTNRQPKLCKFETRLNDKKDIIELRMGVVGSPVDYFGWNMFLTKNEFPLRVGFKKIFASPGASTMILSYNGQTLKFAFQKGSSVWNRLFPFSISVDPELKNPRELTATMEGFERNALGLLVKHVQQTCHF